MIGVQFGSIAAYFYLRRHSVNAIWFLGLIITFGKDKFRAREILRNY